MRTELSWREIPQTSRIIITFLPKLKFMSRLPFDATVAVLGTNQEKSTITLSCKAVMGVWVSNCNKMIIVG